MHSLEGVVLAVALAVATARNVDAARTILRALPGTTADSMAGFAGVQDYGDKLDRPGQGLQGLQGLGVDILEELEEKGEVLDIMVPPYIWGAAEGFVEEFNETRMKLTPSERISMSSVMSMLPHFNKSCSCENLKCSCCVTVDVIHRNLTACASLAYIREKLAIVGQLDIKNRTIFERELISGSNPPPLCLPVPQLPIVRICFRFSNISFTSDAQFQACSAVELGFVFTQPLLRLRFGCLKMGHEGIHWSGTPSANSLSFESPEDAQTAFQQFAAALNSTEKEQFQLLQSILREQEFYDKSPPVLPSRNRKMSWPVA